MTAPDGTLVLSGSGCQSDNHKGYLEVYIHIETKHDAASWFDKSDREAEAIRV